MLTDDGPREYTQLKTMPPTFYTPYYPNFESHSSSESNHEWNNSVSTTIRAGNFNSDTFDLNGITQQNDRLIPHHTHFATNVSQNNKDHQQSFLHPIQQSGNIASQVTYLHPSLAYELPLTSYASQNLSPCSSKVSAIYTDCASQNMHSIGTLSELLTPSPPLFTGLLAAGKFCPNDEQRTADNIFVHSLYASNDIVKNSLTESSAEFHDDGTRSMNSTPGSVSTSSQPRNYRERYKNRRNKSGDNLSRTYPPISSQPSNNNYCDILDEGPVNCVACKIKFASRRLLINHVGRSEKCREYIGKNYDDEWTQAQMQDMMPELIKSTASPVCPHCSHFISCYSGNIRRHINTCERKKGNKTLLGQLQHRQNGHSNDGEQRELLKRIKQEILEGSSDVLPPEMENPYRCVWCRFVTYYKGNMKRHLATCHRCPEEILFTFDIERMRHNANDRPKFDELPIVPRQMKGASSFKSEVEDY